MYRKRVRRVDDQARPGDLVAVYSEPDGERPALIGYGLYNPRSEIVVRIIRFAPELPDGPFWDATLARALQLRREVLRLDEVTDAYRIVHAEADGLSGSGRGPFGRHAQCRGLQSGDVSAVSASFSVGCSRCAGRVTR